MDELITWLQKVGPIAGGILVPLGGLWIKLRNGRQDPAAVRSMKQHAKLHESLPESTRGPIQTLISFEAERYSEAQMRKGRRKVNGGAVAAFVLIGLITGAIVYGSISLGFVWWGGFIIAGIAGLIGAAFLIAGAPQLFTYGDEESKADKKSG